MDLTEIIPFGSFDTGTLWAARHPDRHPITEPPTARIINTSWDYYVPEYVVFELVADPYDPGSWSSRAAHLSARQFAEIYRPIPPRTRYERILAGISLCENT